MIVLFEGIEGELSSKLNMETPHVVLLPNSHLVAGCIPYVRTNT